MKILLTLIVALVAFSGANFASDSEGENEKPSSWTLITETPEEGFQLAIRLSRKGVTETQGDREVLFAGRAEYAEDPDSLIAASQVIAIHFQTIARANDYWRED